MATTLAAATQQSTIERSQVAIIVPTCNAAAVWEPLCGALQLQGFPPSQVLIIDSSSEDDTRSLARKAGFQVICIERSDFNHGGTRQLAATYVPWASIVVYLTQDAIPASADAVDHLIAIFHDPEIAAAYGRQLPRPGAGPIEAHARTFNYPAQSSVRSYESRHALGFKATFMSNSFAAYRVQALTVVGGFPTDVIIAEDALVAARLLLAGWKTAYVAEAQVYHSHAFTVSQEFRRYFDIGVCHRREAWVSDYFGTPGGEGFRFVFSELQTLVPHHLHLVPLALIRTVSKAAAYYLGQREARLGADWARRLSYHKGFWDKGTDNPTPKPLRLVG